MKKRICLFLVLCFMGASLCGCGKQFKTITFTDSKELHYHGRTYNYYDDYFDFGWREEWAQDEAWVNIGSLFSTNVNVTGVGIIQFYGNEEDSPAVIRSTEGLGRVYVREDIQLDCSTLKPYNSEQAFPFTIQEILTGNIVPHPGEKEKAITSRYELIAEFEEYPPLRVKLVFCKTEDAVYLEPRWDTNLYEVTDEFAAILQQFEHYE